MTEGQNSVPGGRWQGIAEAVATADRAAAEKEAAVGLGYVGRILIATFGAWLALLAIPGAFPWNTADNGDRALVIGCAVMTLIALGSIPLSMVLKDSRSVGVAWLGLAAALFAVGFAALQVIRALIVPATINKDVVLGVGLLVMLGFAFTLAWRRQVMGVAATSRVSPLTLVGFAVAILLIGAYLVVTNSLLNVIKAPAEDWARYTDLRNGLEALAFGAAGALLGTTIQKQSTDRAASRADENGSVAAANYMIASRALDLAEQGRAPEAGTDEGTVIAHQERATQIRELRTQLRLPR